MDKEYFINAGIQPSLQFEPTMMHSSSWNSFSAAAAAAAQELNCSPEQASSCFLNPNWDRQGDHFAHMDSAFASMASSSSPDSCVPADAFVLRELIGKLGGPVTHSSGEPFPVVPPSTYSNPGSYTTTPLSSPPNKQLQVPIGSQFVNGNMPNLRNSAPLNPGLPSSLSTDPKFAERAAKFSFFGSRSFNGRTSQFVGANNAELPYRFSAPIGGNGKLPRVLSSPLLKQGGSPIDNKMELRPAAPNGPVFPVGSDQRIKIVTTNGASSNEESSLSEQVPSGETGLKTPQELNSRKRKAAARGKAKEDNANKGTEVDADKDVKRQKVTEANAGENVTAKTNSDEEEKKAGEDKANQKPPEPPKDYIHVRARRGQATDSHSLAERVRREKISERMKLLQDLVPGCNKVTGKALMLDEIINYVQSLQHQVEFLSMKLASVNPRLDDMDNLLSKDIFQSNGSLPHSLFPVDSSDPVLYKNHHHHQSPQPQNNTSATATVSLDGFIENLPQFPPFSEDDLHSIVQMGYGQDAAFHSQSFPGSNQTSHMKIEL